MKLLSYTEGPWSVKSSPVAGCNGDVAIVNKKKSLVAVAYYRSTDETVHNARLIAAAPDLLEALIGIAFTLEHREGLKYRKDLVTDDELMKLKAAIAKAEEGEGERHDSNTV